MARPITGSGPSLPGAPLAHHTFELSEVCSAAECAHEQAELDDELLDLVLDAHRRDPREYGVVPFRPALLAYELRITRALPELARCLEPLPELDPRARASVRALERRRAEALDELLQEFARCDHQDARADVAGLLARSGARDDRVLAAFTRTLEEDPVNGACRLIEYGDARAVPALAQALDRITPTYTDEHDPLLGEDVVALASGIRALGGALSDPQQAKLEVVLKWRDEQWSSGALFGPFEESSSKPVPRPPSSPRLGRNAPCHCGSGKKYKKCHLEQEERVRQA